VWRDPFESTVRGLNAGTAGVAWADGRLYVLTHLEPGFVYEPASGSVAEVPAGGSNYFPAVAAGGAVSVGSHWLDTATLTWHEAANMPGPVREFPTTVAHDGSLYVWGGNACGPGASCTRLVDPEIGLVWTPPR
jgi:hypothetical protein